MLALLPAHTRRSEESQALQQFSTPLPLGLAALTAAAITPADRVLEPSAGTGLLAILAATTERARYLEPFVGGGSMLEVMAPHFGLTRASDVTKI